jgi:hypothetical protein
MRSRAHRVMVAAYTGAGFALVFQGLAGFIAHSRQNWWQNPKGPLLPALLIMTLFALTGLRHAFSVPAELRANWLFQIAAESSPAAYLRGVRKALYLLLLAPMLALLTPLHVILWGWPAGALHVLYATVVAALLIDLLLALFNRLPFTCPVVPGRADLKSTWPLYILAYLLYVTALAAVELWLLSQPARFIFFFAAAALAKVGLLFYQRAQLTHDYSFEFNARPDPVVRTLELEQ